MRNFNAVIELDNNDCSAYILKENGVEILRKSGYHYTATPQYVMLQLFNKLIENGESMFVLHVTDWKGGENTLKFNC